jgi:hypothetical protein
MRYYYNVLSRKFALEWFVFQDDDLYIRPYSLINLLSLGRFSSTQSNHAVAIVAAKFYRGFRFSNLWQLPEYSMSNISCIVNDVHDFPVAQPLFMNNEAMLRLQTRILSCNAMTSLHSLWGGSHDSLVSVVLLWM